MPVFHTHHREGFTLIELLVVIAIIAILSVVVILTLNPAQLLQNSRDSQRLYDMSTLARTIGTYESNTINGTTIGTSSIVYISIPDTAATSTAGSQCQGISGLPTLPGGYTYHCAASNFLRAINGTGWVPINFTQTSLGGSPISALPIDPINTTTSGLFYTYSTNGTQWELTAGMEAAADQQNGTNDKVSTDGGLLPNTYEIGSMIGLEPVDYGGSSTNSGGGGGSGSSSFGGFASRKTITVTAADISPANGTALTNFPLMIAGTYSYLAASSSGGGVQNSNGYDVAFSSNASGTSFLPYEREFYNSSNGASVFWVQVPTLSSSSHVIYLFYGSSTITSDQSNPSGVWDSNYQGVYHLSWNGSSLNVNDSTGNGHNGTNDGATGVSSGITSAGAGSFNGGSTYITGSGISIASGPFTISYWEEPSSTNNTEGFSIGSVTAPDQALLMPNKSNTSFDFGMYFDDFNVTVPNMSSGWSYVTFTMNSSKVVTAYWDGSSLGTRGASNFFIGNTSWDIGHGIGDGNGYSGLIDEVEVSNIQRSQDWIDTEYNNQSSPSSFYSIL